VYNTLIKVFKHKTSHLGSFSFSSSKLFKKHINKMTILNSMLSMCNTYNSKVSIKCISGCSFNEHKFKNLIESQLHDHSIIYLNLNTGEINSLNVSLITCHSIGDYSFVITSDSHYLNLQESDILTICNLTVMSSLFMDQDYLQFVNIAIAPYN